MEPVNRSLLERLNSDDILSDIQKVEGAEVDDNVELCRQQGKSTLALACY
ncbi:hypothetical protein CCP3SC1_950014 [Gammaproteobacteria bacterium]